MTAGTEQDGAASQPAGTARPLPMTLVCTVGSLLVLAAVARILARWEQFQALTAARQAATIGALALTAATLFGYWGMRRWGLWVVSITLAGRAMVGAAGWIPLKLTDLVMPGCLLLVGLAYARRLR